MSRLVENGSFSLVLGVMVLGLPIWGWSDEPTITVGGEAEIRVVPDQALLTAGVESRASTVEAATSENDAKIKSILKFLQKSGIEEKHIRTEYLSITPLMRPASNSAKIGGRIVPQANQNQDPFRPDSDESLEKPIGYLVSRQFAITIDDLARFEPIYKGLIESGINRVQGIQFQTSELRKHRDRARIDAVRAAREKAKAMAGELGATLASIQTIRESRNTGNYAMQNSISDPFGGPSDDLSSVAPGQISIRSAVEIVFVLGQVDLKEAK